jgi:hypothetical protein
MDAEEIENMKERERKKKLAEKAYLASLVSLDASNAVSAVLCRSSKIMTHHLKLQIIVFTLSLTANYPDR